MQVFVIRLLEWLFVLSILQSFSFNRLLTSIPAFKNPMLKHSCFKAGRCQLAFVEDLTKTVSHWHQDVLCYVYDWFHADIHTSNNEYNAAESGTSHGSTEIESINSLYKLI